MNQQTKPTCGPMYKEAIDHYCGSTGPDFCRSNDPALVRVFAAGFVSGQAEKVYLGACRAAMFRPSAERYGMLIDVASDVARRYGLTVVTGVKFEIWICRDEWAPMVRTLKDAEENSRIWHECRGFLCGIPFEECDYEFHLREGHGQRCD